MQYEASLIESSFPSPPFVGKSWGLIRHVILDLAKRAGNEGRFWGSLTHDRAWWCGSVLGVTDLSQAETVLCNGDGHHDRARAQRSQRFMGSPRRDLKRIEGLTLKPPGVVCLDDLLRFR